MECNKLQKKYRMGRNGRRFYEMMINDPGDQTLEHIRNDGRNVFCINLNFNSNVY